MLFLQVVEPGMYPPIIAACAFDGGSGLGCHRCLPRHRRTPSSGWPTHPAIFDAPDCGTPPVSLSANLDFLRYYGPAASLALRWRPDIVYASDWLGMVPGLLAARLAGARLVYHEHDSPSPGALRSWLARFRAKVARNADLVIFPDAERAEIVRREIGFPAERLRMVWNLPRRAQQLTLAPKADMPLLLWYHGSTPPIVYPPASLRL